MRVLVTEDNQVNQLVAEKMLKRLGCEVVIAKDGYEALEKLKTSKVDLVFMDLHMPGLDGTLI
jgi:CheY-like chemotaxis protein